MKADGDSVERALDAVMHGITAKGTVQSNPALDDIRSRIGALMKEVDSADARDELRQLRADLSAHLENFLKNSLSESASDPAAPLSPLSPAQQAIVDQRLAACLEFAFSQSEVNQKPAAGGLVWLTRRQV